MANYCFNCVFYLSEEGIVYYIQEKTLHIWYVFIYTIQPREKYKCQSHTCYLKIISSLGDLKLHQS